MARYSTSSRRTYRGGDNKQVQVYGTRLIALLQQPYRQSGKQEDEVTIDFGMNMEKGLAMLDALEELLPTLRANLLEVQKRREEGEIRQAEAEAEWQQRLADPEVHFVGAYADLPSAYSSRLEEYQKLQGHIVFVNVKVTAINEKGIETEGCGSFSEKRSYLPGDMIWIKGRMGRGSTYDSFKDFEIVEKPDIEPEQLIYKIGG